MRAAYAPKTIDGSLTMTLPCAFATRRFEDGSAAYQMAPWHPWAVVTATGFPAGANTNARRFVRRRNRALAPVSRTAIALRTAIYGAWCPYRVAQVASLAKEKRT